MHLEKQVSSLEPSRRLRDLGVEQESYFYWVKFPDGEWKLTLTHASPYIEYKGKKVEQWSEWCSAFTVAELGDWQKEFDSPQPWYSNGSWWWYRDEEQVETDTQANAYAERGIYLLENKLITLPR